MRSDVRYPDPLSTQEPIRRHKRWPWVVAIGAVLAVIGAFGIVALVGINRALDDLDAYTADLTVSADGFPSDTRGGAVRGFDNGAYRMSVTGSPGVVMTGIIAPTQHLVLAIEVDVRPEAQPVGSEFGVLCWQGESGGYGFTVGADGSTRLARMSGAGSALAADSLMTTVARGTTTPLGTGTVHSLMIACGVIDSRATVSGYIDGVKVLSTQVGNPVAYLNNGGMVGLSTSNERASWSVLRFMRRGVHTMPAGWNQ